MDRTELDELLRAAREAAAGAYAPYSEFPVGAAVLTDRGVFTGFNIENASTPLGLCAERAALTNALVHGARNIRAVAIACDPERPTDGPRDLNATMPCGACRQWLAELAPDALVVTNGSDRVFTVAELLPLPFALPGRS